MVIARQAMAVSRSLAAVYKKLGYGELEDASVLLDALEGQGLTQPPFTTGLVADALGPYLYDTDRAKLLQELSTVAEALAEEHTGGASKGGSGGHTKPPPRQQKKKHNGGGERQQPKQQDEKPRQPETTQPVPTAAAADKPTLPSTASLSASVLALFNAYGTECDDSLAEYLVTLLTEELASDCGDGATSSQSQLDAIAEVLVPFVTDAPDPSEIYADVSGHVDGVRKALVSYLAPPSPPHPAAAAAAGQTNKDEDEENGNRPGQKAAAAAAVPSKQEEAQQHPSTKGNNDADGDENDGPEIALLREMYAAGAGGAAVGDSGGSAALPPSSWFADILSASNGDFDIAVELLSTTPLLGSSATLEEDDLADTAANHKRIMQRFEGHYTDGVTWTEGGGDGNKGRQGRLQSKRSEDRLLKQLANEMGGSGKKEQVIKYRDGQQFYMKASEKSITVKTAREQENEARLAELAPKKGLKIVSAGTKKRSAQ